MLPPLLQSFKNAGLIMCLYAFKNGSWLDLSGNNLTLSPQNRARLGPEGLNIVTNGSSSDSATATNTSALDIANTQAVAFFCKYRANGLSEGDFPPIFSTRPWVANLDAGLAFGVEGTGATRFNAHFANGSVGFDVPSARTAVASVGQGRWIKASVLVNQLTAKRTYFYLDHVLDANSADMSAYAPISIDTSSDLNIARDINGGGTRRFNGSIQYLCVLKQTTDFTATQETQIHAELDSICAAQEPVQSAPADFSIPDSTPNLVSQVALTTNGVYDTVKAEKMTVGQNISIGKNKVLGQTFTGVSAGGSGTRIAGATNSGISGAAAASMDFWISGVTSTSRMAIGSLGTNSNGATFGLELSTLGLGYLYFVGFNRDAQTTVRPITDGALHHVGATYDGVTTVKFYVDGVEAAATAPLASALNITNSPFHVGQAVYDSAYGFRGSIHVGRLWNKTLSAAEMKALHDRQRPGLSYQMGYGLKASGATAEGGVAGSFLSNSPFRFGNTTGRFKIESELINGIPSKTITCSTAGHVYVDLTAITSNLGNLTGFGEWTFWAQKAASGSTTMILSLVSKDAALYSTAGNQTYSVALDSTESVHLFRGNGTGAGTTLTLSAASTIALSTWYRIRVTRDVLGVFRTYIMGGAFTNEVLLTAISGSNPSAADRNYFVGNYLVIDIGVNDKIALASVDGSMGLRHKLIA